VDLVSSPDVRPSSVDSSLGGRLARADVLFPIGVVSGFGRGDALSDGNLLRRDEEAATGGATSLTVSTVFTFTSVFNVESSGVSTFLLIGAVST